jgi:3-methyladenine DNA glycosylase AlkD
MSSTPAMSFRRIQKALRDLSDPEQAAHLSRFFKTGRGQYGEGDVFLGIRVPVLRRVAHSYPTLNDDGIRSLLNSKYHEERMVALLIMVHRFQRVGEDERSALFNLFLSMSARINNWDLVDLSAPHIVGRPLLGRDRSVLNQLAASPLVWDRRIAIVSTLTFIRSGDLSTTFEVSHALLGDPHDLIHKAVGWMLREAGKKDGKAMRAFLDTHLGSMARTTLRYAIERFPEPERLAYLRKNT